MGTIRQYLLSVTAAALICSILKSIAGDKKPFSILLKLVCGLFLTFTLVNPLVTLQKLDFSFLPENIIEGAEEAVTDGTKTAENNLRKIIKQKSEAYILDKAADLNINVTAEITVSTAYPYAPCSVTISGAASPYAKQVLEECIANDLGITKEGQHWS